MDALIPFAMVPLYTVRPTRRSSASRFRRMKPWPFRPSNEARSPKAAPSTCTSCAGLRRIGRLRSSPWRTTRRHCGGGEATPMASEAAPDAAGDDAPPPAGDSAAADAALPLRRSLAAASTAAGSKESSPSTPSPAEAPSGPSSPPSSSSPSARMPSRQASRWPKGQTHTESHSLMATNTAQQAPAALSAASATVGARSCRKPSIVSSAALASGPVELTEADTACPSLPRPRIWSAWSSARVPDTTSARPVLLPLVLPLPSLLCMAPPRARASEAATDPADRSATPRTRSTVVFRRGLRSARTSAQANALGCRSTASSQALSLSRRSRTNESPSPPPNMLLAALLGGNGTLNPGSASLSAWFTAKKSLYRSGTRHRSRPTSSTTTVYRTTARVDSPRVMRALPLLASAPALVAALSVLAAADDARRSGACPSLKLDPAPCPGSAASPDRAADAPDSRRAAARSAAAGLTSGEAPTTSSSAWFLPALSTKADSTAAMSAGLGCSNTRRSARECGRGLVRSFRSTRRCID
mmetsp:Transcript_22684/g.85950  ORF Transcript_22684/g.85950 Transcript_22684/m.85950 type:complete len:528 (+) Transcript_22684:816-2399(+)